ncbi:FxSxx-COOH system tetratricopeptide repeat protein [Streptomyces bambusae]|uniref:Tetratricopeptide repeat protein n=1 Tax=Streptomyces bambusae TaxID=1550616 RepID=A0ABS6Z006_9ACTN|nr:FxSxx-COOH system tetratricopeptide repeat protein [Streptomyces bambusae]MBW5481064.1 tetratricopeptide repeat protein [Streptomyces bambusae]
MIQSGNATATHGGIAVTGIYNPTVHLPPEAMRPPSEVDAPAGLNNLPHQPGHFIGRSRDLARLDGASRTPGTTLVQVVHGLGGVGKSTLAACWAATRPHGCAPVRWIAAENPASVQQGLASLATALQPALASALPTEALAEWGLQWLASHTGWLLILDNVNDPADIAALSARTTGGRILITSRLATGWIGATTLVRLDVMDEAESIALLTRITGHRDLDGATDLCAIFGYLPLAIEQAAAYLAQNPLTTPRDYLGLLAEHPADMYGHGGATTPADRTIARIWDVTLDQIATRQPAAIDLLRTMAWYAAENIPTALVDGLTDPPALNQAIGLLTAYSMIKPDPGTSTLAMHRLVAAFARSPDPDDPHRRPDSIDLDRQRAASNLCSALPPTVDDPASWPTWRNLLPHIDAFADHTTPDTDTSNTALLLHAAGISLIKQGVPAQGIRHLQRAVTAYERLLGNDNPATLTSRDHLALAYQEAGDLGSAIPLHEQTLADCRRVLGEDHPHTVASCNNLALAYQKAGDLGRAIPLYDQIVTDCERLLGEDDRATLTARNNLASAYEEAGDLSSAIPLLVQSVKDRLRVLGEDHPDTLTSWNNLALAYEKSGDLGSAIALYERTVADCERLLGEGHPDTLTSRSNLAVACLQAGDLGRAIPLSEQVLTDSEQVLGMDHPVTMTSRSNLASVYKDAGDLGSAIPLYEQTLSDRLRVLGEGHQDTLIASNNLALAYQEAGDLSSAIPLYQQTLTNCEQLLGSDHSLTRAVREDLAYAMAKRDDRNWTT